MIVVRLMGGLGNQLFQYAFARRLAVRHGSEVKFDLSYFEQCPLGDTPRVYELGNLSVKAGIANRSEIAALTGEYSRLLERLEVFFGRFGGVLPRSTNVARERRFGFCPEALNLSDNVYLVGYWHSDRYFADISDVIRLECSVKGTPVGRNGELAEMIAGVEAVALHVRRGDYVNDPKTSAYHGQCSIAYYHKCVARLLATGINPHLFVFSDDPQWAKEHLRFDLPTEYVAHNPPDLGYEDLRLMSLCKHAIIANSSFSWWGAWLIRNPEKIVYAPARWFAQPELNLSDLTPKTWHRVSV